MKFREFLLNESEKVQPKTKRELKNIIQKTIEEQGPNCDLNFIDVSLIKDMSDLKTPNLMVTSLSGMFQMLRI
jgi:hypothetical protein